MQEGITAALLWGFTARRSLQAAHNAVALYYSGTCKVALLAAVALVKLPATF